MLVLEKSSQILFDFDKSFNKKIVGTDEAGRGPGAGGVFVIGVFGSAALRKLVVTADGASADVKVAENDLFNSAFLHYLIKVLHRVG